MKQLMACLGLVMASACGGPQSPAAQRCTNISNGVCVAEIPVDAWEEPSPDAEEPADAEVDAGEQDLSFLADAPKPPPMDISVFSTILGNGITYGAMSPFPPAPVATAAADAEEPESTEENGVKIIFLKKRPWCARSGGRDGKFCGFDPASCNKGRGGCAPVTNMACFGMTSRTSGEDSMICMASYGECESLRSAAELSTEFQIMGGACAVFRYRK